jgi:protoheme IX farnesyltransferase
MYQVNTDMIQGKSHLTQKLSDYAALMKLRLGALVVFSAVIGFLFGVQGSYNFTSVLWLVIGGVLVTGASNAINQIIERDIDKLMTRTQNRPLAVGRMNVLEAMIFSGFCGLAGIILLWQMFNPTAGVLAAISLISYAFIYTPLKRIHPVAVFVGAIPGALPVMIGYVCATGQIDFVAVLLFSVQFLWQFPHFWAIAWVQYEDYKKADIMLLPSSGGKNKFSALQCVIYTAGLVLISIIPYFFGMINFASTIVVILMGCIFFWQAVQLWLKCDDASARSLMFGSFAYLPIVQLALLFGKM